MDLLKKAVEKNRSLHKENTHLYPAAAVMRGIPTLKKGVYRKCSPMLTDRFRLCSRWRMAAHGNWLSIEDMESLWTESDDPFLKQIRDMQKAGERGWPDEASAVFRPERLSLFACSELNYEKIYLLWLAAEEEPELWVYDANGESHYKNLAEYVKAYLSDDISAAWKPWRE